MEKNIIDIIVKNADERCLLFKNIAFVDINDISLIESAAKIFDDVYVYSSIKMIMREFNLLRRKIPRIHAFYQNDLSALANIDVLVSESIGDISFINVRSAKFIYLTEGCEEILGFDKITNNLFIKNDNIMSSSNQWFDEGTLLILKNIKPIKHSYGKYVHVEKGKTAFISKDASLFEKEQRISPYSETWLFSNERSRKADNVISLERDMSDEDMLDVVNLLSRAEFKRILK